MHALLALAVVTGTWVGESVCVGNRHPACKDEVIRYHVPEPDAAGKTHVIADKKVDGEWGVMGELDFVFDGKDTMVCDFARPAFTGKWTLTVRGDALEGTLVVDEGGKKDVARRVKARREK